jgi:hypothetical protein
MWRRLWLEASAHLRFVCFIRLTRAPLIATHAGMSVQEMWNLIQANPSQSSLAKPFSLIRSAPHTNVISQATLGYSRR